MTLDPGLPVFYAAEIDAYSPATGAISGGPGWGVDPWAVDTWGTQGDAGLPASSATLRASDMGYRTLESDPDGLQVYPPTLASAFQIDRRLNLDPAQPAAAAAWGTVSLSNAAGDYDGIAARWNATGRAVRVFLGQKAIDQDRLIPVDPAYAGLTALFKGVAGQWSLGSSTLDIPLRDATYWLELQNLQTALYGGTGGLDGTTQLTGTPKPKTRGGTAGSPVCNVTPVLVDPANLIYQYTDAPGTVVTLYEGGDGTNITFQADVADLYSGSTNPGQYRTCNALGLFQLGSSPQRAITVDVTGQFPVAGGISKWANIARYLLSEDLALPAENLDTASFAAANTAYPYISGVYFGPEQVLQGPAAIDQIIGSIGANLVPKRDGTLSVQVLRAIPAGATPVASFSPANAIAVTPQALPASLAPPPYRWRVGYQHNYTVQTTDLSPVVTAARKQFLAAADRYGTWSSTDVLAAFRRPNDPAPLIGPLLVEADATAVAQDLGALWGTLRHLYAVQVPVSLGAGLDFGDVVSLAWPIDLLANGKLGQVVGEQFTSGDATTTLLVLV